MAITQKIEPQTRMAAYSPIPIRWSSSNVTTQEGFKYVLSLIYDKATTSTYSYENYPEGVKLKFTFSSAHQFEIGDTLLVYNSTNDYGQVVTVFDKPSTTTIVIYEDFDLTLINGSVLIGKFIQFENTPDSDGEVKLEISNVLKDFVDGNLELTDSIFDGSSTEQGFDLYYGERYKFIHEFLDNNNSGGKVNFVNSSLSSSYITDTLQFKVGDYITIEQDLYKWYFDTVTNAGGYLKLGYPSAPPGGHVFRRGQEVYVTDVTEYAPYNGRTSVQFDNAESSPQTFITTYKDANSSYVGSIDGYVWGVPRPEYNVTTQITDIGYDATYGVRIYTNIAWGGGTPAIGGKMKFADGRTSLYWKEDSYETMYVYNARFDRNNFRMGQTVGMDERVVTSSDWRENRICTILNTTGNGTTQTGRRYRIEKSTKSHLLAHWAVTYLAGTTIPTTNRGMRYKFYDSSDNLLVSCLLEAPAGVSEYNWYAPVGVDQLINDSANRTDTSGTTTTLDLAYDSISYYDVNLETDSSKHSHEIRFEINDDCSEFDLYHIMWEDAFGSWVSYPFKYKHKEMSEFDRKTYYEKEGRFDTDDDKFDWAVDDSIPDTTIGGTLQGGETTYFGRSRDKYVLTSGWIEEFENDLIKDMLKSTATYLQKPDGTLTKCEITNKDYEFFQKEQDYLWNYQIEVRESYNDVRY